MIEESNGNPMLVAGGTTAGPEAGGTPATCIRGLHSSTPLPTLQHKGGEDTVEVFAWVKWSDNWTELLKKLDTLQKMAQEDGPQFLDILLPGGREGELWQVHRTGFKCGNDKGSGPGYSFRLTFAGCTFGLQRVVEPAEAATVGNVKVRFGSEFLMDVGGIAPAWKWFKERIVTLGGAVTQNLLSLADPCVDLVDIPVEVFCHALREERFVSRWQARGQWGNGHQDNSFRLGSHGKMIRVYDKVLEVRHEPTKEAIIIERRWNMRIPRAATRVEFSLGRCFLKEYGIDTVEHWIEKRGGICAKLCSDYVRFTS